MSPRCTVTNGDFVRPWLCRDQTSEQNHPWYHIFALKLINQNQLWPNKERRLHSFAGTYKYSYRGCRDEYSMHVFECYFGVYFSSWEETRETNAAILLDWVQLSEYIFRHHRICIILCLLHWANEWGSKDGLHTSTKCLTPLLTFCWRHHLWLRNALWNSIWNRHLRIKHIWSDMDFI